MNIHIKGSYLNFNYQIIQKMKLKKK